MPGRKPARQPATFGAPLKIAMMAALPVEVRPFLRQRQVRRRRDLGLPAWEFKVGQGRGVVALSGMGWPVAHLAGERLLALCRPQILLSCGFGGALTPELAPGAIVLGDSFWHYFPETGVLEGVAAPPPPRPLPEMVRYLKQAGLAAFPGSLITTPFIINKARQAGPLLHLTHPVLDLETSALAEVAAAHGLAFVSLRAITDGAGEEMPDFLLEGWQPGRKMGPRTAFTWLAADPRRAKTLLHLRRRSRLAAQQLAQALNLLLDLM